MSEVDIKYDIHSGYGWNRESTQCTEIQAVRALQESGKSIKTAIVMILTGASRKEAEIKLQVAKGGVCR